MSAELKIEGLEQALEGFDLLFGQIEGETQKAIEQAVEQTFEESQRDVPYDHVTKHEPGYVHLRDSGKKEVGHLEGSVSYGTDHSWYVEQGTSRQAAQPFLNPAFERARARLLVRAKVIAKGGRV